MRKFITRHSSLLRAAAIATVALSFATVFGAWHRYPELFSHFRLPYLGASLLLLLAFAILRRRVEVAALIACAVLNAAYVLPWYSLPGVHAAAGNRAFTVMLANVYARNDRYADFLDMVRDLQPDLLIVQELTPAWLTAIEPELPGYSRGIAAPRDDAFGIGVFSRLPLEDVERIDSPPLGLPTLLFTLRVGDEPVSVITLHPMAPTSAARSAARDEQLAAIAGLAAERHADVIVGDLNTTMWGAHYGQMLRATGMRNSREGFGVLPTWPTFLPVAMIPLDHCLVSDRIDVLRTATGPRYGSDHLPLTVSLAVSSDNDSGDHAASAASGS